MNNGNIKSTSQPKLSLLEMQNGSYMQGSENESNVYEIQKLFNNFIKEKEYSVLQTGFKKFDNNNLNLNNIVSKLMRMS